MRIVVCGAGALGSWASAVLAASRFPEVELCVVDMDETIEAHNLNRQVLFGETDIGKPKAQRAMERLGEIDDRMRLQALQVAIDPLLIDQLTGGTVEYEVVDEAFQRDLDVHRGQVTALAGALREATAVLSCPDNHQTRWCLNVIAERLRIPLVNGAMEGFVGRVHVCDPNDCGRCLVCWLGTSIAEDIEREQCTGVWENAPVPSIATSAAIIGASQAAALIAVLACDGEPTLRFHVFDGMAGALVGYRAPNRDPAECPDHLFNARDASGSPGDEV
jgi:molybdopterin/thiamine biosynthesis adenylyltransferase